MTSSLRPFRAVLEPGVPNTLRLYCRKCDTWEEEVALHRVQDHAALHDRWFHDAYVFDTVLKRVASMQLNRKTVIL